MPFPYREFQVQVVLIPGLGAVSTTFIAGILLTRKGLNIPIGSLTQLGKIKVGKGKKSDFVKIKDFVKLASLDDLEFGGWDIFEDDCYEAAVNAGVLKSEDLDPIKKELAALKPMKAVFNKDYVKKLDGKWVKKAKTASAESKKK